MTNNLSRPWWLRKRLLLPVASLILIAGAALVAFLRSDTSTIVVYNQTRDRLPPLLIRACDQFRTYPSVQGENSFRFRLAKRGKPGPIQLELATDPPWRWEGEYIEPSGGYRVSLRLWPEGEVEAHTQISIWRRLFRNPGSGDS